VDVNNGKVTLSGTVGSAAEKTQAYWDAYVAGVKAVDDSALEVKKWARDKEMQGKKHLEKSEEEIENAVKDALIYDPRVSSFEITPEVVRTTVILRGTVDNLKAKRAATQDARNTVGVRIVENRIKVRPGEPLSDKKIESKINNALLRDPYLESYEITVDVVNGVANLYGTVDTFFEKSQADDATSKVTGVLMVDNNLTVRGDYNLYTYDPYLDETYLPDYDWYTYEPKYPSKSDWQIKEDINDELFWSPFVDADDVQVAVDGGTATLTGTVDSWSESKAAETNAYEAGAMYVDNNLTISIH
jgi:osmotically-inducible protein OsmY